MSADQDRAWAKALRALDLLAIYGEREATEILLLEVGCRLWVNKAIVQARRILDQHRRGWNREDARAVYLARCDYLYHASVAKGDIRNARYLARDQALAQGVILSEEQTPLTRVDAGLDVSQLLDEERAELRDLLARVRARRSREGLG